MTELILLFFQFSGFDGKALWWINDDGEELNLTFTQLLEESNK